MSIRLFGARRKTQTGVPAGAAARNKILRPVVAFAVMVSAVSSLLVATQQSASANIDDWKPANWNMQGSDGAGGSKWTNGVAQLLRRGHDVIALQEAGMPPASAGRIDDFGRMTRAVWRNGAFDANTVQNTDQRQVTNTYVLGGNSYTRSYTYTIYTLAWQPRRNRTYYITWLQTDPNANRVNLAMVTDELPDSIHVTAPGLQGGRPALGVRLDDTLFWTVHAFSGGGNDAPRLLTNIGNTSAGVQGVTQWAAMGDYNRVPNSLAGRLPAGMHIVKTDEATHRSATYSDNELDYMVANVVPPGLFPGVDRLGDLSDHNAVFYFEMRGGAPIEIFLPTSSNASVGIANVISVPNGVDDVAAFSSRIDDRADLSWTVEEHPGYAVIRSNKTQQCWDSGNIEGLMLLAGSTCWQNPYSRFLVAPWPGAEPGQFQIKSATDGFCIGPYSTGGNAALSTTLSCSDPRSKLNFRWDGDPGAGEGGLVGVSFLEVNPTYTVAADGSAQYRTVQEAINAVPTGGAAATISISKGTYNEVITVPADKANLTIKGATGNAADVVIKYDRAHGYLKPDGTKYGTETSAVASFKAPGMRVEGITIQNTFDPSAHPEISPYETQAVALVARGDRQVYYNVRIISTQDTVYVKGNTTTEQSRQYFRNAYIAGNVDFIFGHSTAVFDRSNIHVWPRVGGTILAPNTDQAKKYGILITNSKVVSSAAANTWYLGRPWHNTTTAWPQAVIRDTELPAGVTTAQPWTDMTPDYSWRSARVFEYNNYGAGAGVNSNRPQLSNCTTACPAGQLSASEYTAKKYLAGTDGWNPVW